MEAPKERPDQELFDFLLERVEILIANDNAYVRNLIAVRKANGLSTAEVADRLGVPEKKIIKFERYDADPKLSMLRRYAHAVNAVVDHSVTNGPEMPAWPVSKESKDTE